MTTNQQMDGKAKAGKGPGPFTEGMSWDSWAERFDFFIKLRGITDPEMKKLLLFTEIGPIYEELRNMAQPDDVRTMALTDIMGLMADRYGETKSIAAKRHDLFTARQQQGQSIRDFSILLRSLIAKAEWGKDSIDMCLCALFIQRLHQNRTDQEGRSANEVQGRSRSRRPAGAV